MNAGFLARLDEVRQRHKATITGPYRWIGNGGRTRKQVHIVLATVDRGQQHVMTFARSGLQSAIPLFRMSERRGMRPVTEFIRYERDYRDDFSIVNQADAIGLERSWEDREALLAMVDELLDENGRLKSLLSERGFTEPSLATV